MKDCIADDHVPLYVKSFHSMSLPLTFPSAYLCIAYQGDEWGIHLVFEKAREAAPCVVVLEDLDSLITDANRSFFLNQLDGLTGNDGLLVIGSTNHFDRLDPGLSSRPSRFDRKL